MRKKTLKNRTAKKNTWKICQLQLAQQRTAHHVDH